MLVDMVKPRGLVLDLGCGTGFVSSFLPRDCRIVGVDISRGMLVKYGGSFPKAVLGDAENLPFRNGSFNFVMSNFSLHWTDLSKSLKEAVRVARLGVGVSIPVAGSLRELGFPFPTEEDVLNHLRDFETETYTTDVPIPFTGWDLVRFFHYTGSSINPIRDRPLTRREVENLINSLGKPRFRVLFLYVKLRS